MQTGTEMGKRTHGLSKHPIYRIWHDMIQRCRNPNSTPYKDYGERGIKVCERWQNFENFRDDMLPTWFPGASIERANCHTGNYEPGNCSWVKIEMQASNRRTTHWMETPWGRMPMARAAKQLGINRSVLAKRIRRGVTMERMFVRRLKPTRRADRVKALQITGAVVAANSLA